MATPTKTLPHHVHGGIVAAKGWGREVGWPGRPTAASTAGSRSNTAAATAATTTTPALALVLHVVLVLQPLLLHVLLDLPCHVRLLLLLLALHQSCKRRLQ